MKSFLSLCEMRSVVSKELMLARNYFKLYQLCPDVVNLDKLGYSVYFSCRFRRWVRLPQQPSLILVLFMVCVLRGMYTGVDLCGSVRATMVLAVRWFCRSDLSYY